MDICRLISDFPHPEDIDQFQNQRSSYLLSGAYYISREQRALGDNVAIFTGGGPKHENLGGLEVMRVGNPDNLWLASELLRLKKRECIDVIHGHSTYGFLALSILKHKIGVPIVIHVHATTLGLLNSSFGKVHPPTGIGVRAAAIREKFVFSFADRLVAVSNAVARNLIQWYGIDGSKISVVHNGVDTRLFAPSSKEEAKRSVGLENTRVVLFVGRLSPIKGIDYLMKAAQTILDEFDDVTFLFVGGVPKFMRGHQANPQGLLADINKSYNDANRLRFLGAIPNNLLPVYYSAADLVVTPSLYEAAPKVILEAMACGTPVIATNVGGIPEVISDGVNGLLVPPADSMALSRALSLLLRDDPLRLELGDKAEKTISEQFTWGRAALELKRTYSAIGA
jgi:D-inositol-3-phosphate glycosyltransferase